MTDRTSKILQWFLYLLLALSAVITVLFYLDSDNRTDLIIYWSYGLLVLGVIIALASSIFGLAANPKGAVKTLMGIGFMVLVGFIAYMLAGNIYSTFQLEKMGVSESVSRFVGAGLIFSYLLAALAVLAILLSSVSKIFK
jgi:hypothetical protein